jgi:hypothetical protein
MAAVTPGSYRTDVVPASTSGTVTALTWTLASTKVPTGFVPAIDQILILATGNGVPIATAVKTTITTTEDGQTRTIREHSLWNAAGELARYDYTFNRSQSGGGLRLAPSGGNYTIKFDTVNSDQMQAASSNMFISYHLEPK